jgi:dinuclear metal center YbgI/SA1388 family protein
MPSLAGVVAALERRYDPAWAQAWDSIGLACGEPDAEVGHVHFAVDPVEVVVEEAIRVGAQLLVTHHPLLLGGTDSVATDTEKGRIVHRLITHGVGLFVAHTNADVARPGVSDALAETLGLLRVRPVEASAERGLGRIGELAQPVSFAELVETAARLLPVASWGVRAGGDPDRVVHTIAVCGGVGIEVAAAASAAGADVLLTSDLKHHSSGEAMADTGLALIDVGHWTSEQPWVMSAAQLLASDLRETGTNVETSVSTIVTDPWDLHTRP